MSANDSPIHPWSDGALTDIECPKPRIKHRWDSTEYRECLPVLALGSKGLDDQVTARPQSALGNPEDLLSVVVNDDHEIENARMDRQAVF